MSVINFNSTFEIDKFVLMFYSYKIILLFIILLFVFRLSTGLFVRQLSKSNLIQYRSSLTGRNGPGGI
jgi:hypothetical protein